MIKNVISETLPTTAQASTATSSVATISSTAITTKLKTLYRAQDTLPKLIEDVSVPEQRVDDCCFKLQTKLDSGRGIREKQFIELDQIFKNLTEYRVIDKVLIVGVANIGKSTLLHNISYQWGKDTEEEMFSNKFDYIFKIKLKKLLDPWVRGALKSLNKKDILTKLTELSIEDQQSELKSRLGNMTTIEVNEFLARCCISEDEKARMFDIKQSEISNVLQEKDSQHKILLLLDGYDEIAHLDKPSNSVVYSLMETINEYKLIMTSRPNAISFYRKQNFGYEVEITGFDIKTAQDYIHKYFTKQQEAEFTKLALSEKAADQSFDRAEIERSYQATETALQALLSTNPTLKDILATPINVSILCLISSDPRSIERLQQTELKAGDLYQEAIFWLGRKHVDKYYSKYHGGADTANLTHLTIEDIFNLPELKALKKIAHDEFTQGSLTISGKTLDRSCSIDSEQSIPVERLYEFGLLRPENTGQVQIADGLENDVLVNRNYVFIHLSFQEYLTAHLLKEKLASGNKDDVRQAAEFIANHRNEPRYLMMLKCLVGIVTSEGNYDGRDGEEISTREGKEVRRAEQLVKNFWEAVSCNVDGVLELGVETKVELLMHLLEQSRIQAKDEIGRMVLDPRIPNLAKMINLIDKVILQDINKWEEQITQSGYLSNAIIEELNLILDQKGDVKSDAIMVSFAVSDTTKDEHESIKQKTNIANIQRLKTATDIITSFINKSEFGSSVVIFNKFINLVKSQNWQVQKLGVESLKQIIKANPELASEAFELIKPLFSASEWQARSAAAECLQQIVKAMPAMEAFELIKPLLTDSEYGVRWAAAKNLPQIIKDQITLSFIAIELQDSIATTLYHREHYFEEVVTEALLRSLYMFDERLSEYYILIPSLLKILDLCKRPDKYEEQWNPTLNRLNTVAHNILKKIVTRLEEDSKVIEWVNDHFEELPQSQSTENFLKEVYHILLDRSKITEVESVFLINSMKYGLTPAITRASKIIFENKEHFSEITQAALNQEDNILAEQYVIPNPTIN